MYDWGPYWAKAFFVLDREVLFLFLMLFYMSIATLKKKSRNNNPNYPISGKGVNGFSLSGGYRNIGAVGQFRLISNTTRTPFRGTQPMGHGGSAGQYYDHPLNSGSCGTNDNTIIKKSSLNTAGMLDTKYKWTKGTYPNYWLKKMIIVTRLLEIKLLIFVTWHKSMVLAYLQIFKTMATVELYMILLGRIFIRVLVTKAHALIILERKNTFACHMPRILINLPRARANIFLLVVYTKKNAFLLPQINNLSLWN